MVWNSLIVEKCNAVIPRRWCELAMGLCHEVDTDETNQRVRKTALALLHQSF